MKRMQRMTTMRKRRLAWNSSVVSMWRILCNVNFGGAVLQNNCMVSLGSPHQN